MSIELYYKNSTGCDNCPLKVDCAETSQTNETDPLATIIELSTRQESTNYTAECQMATALSRYRNMLKKADYIETNDIDPDEFLCHSLQTIFEKNLFPTKTKEYDQNNIANLEKLLSNLSDECRIICAEISIYKSPVMLSFFEDVITDAAECEQISSEYIINPTKLITELLNSQIILEVKDKYIVRPEFRNILRKRLNIMDKSQN
jgi:hypothetical protein